ncbi:MAG: hypothetical protein IBJ12_03435 [Sphingomonadaceae bacterium]|nr:hypothetical protein [Sphingomonadaceae bacterium]
MRGAGAYGRLLRALGVLLPQVDLSLVQERPWHSLTFSGVQLSIAAKLGSVSDENSVLRFADILPTHEFDLGNQLVADIAVTEIVQGPSCFKFRIDALLLDSE